MKIKYVFFDCWDTVINFERQDKYEEVKIIYDHVINKELCSFEGLCEAHEALLKDYHLSTKFEVPQDRIIAYLVESKNLKLDVSYKKICQLRTKAWRPTLMEGIKEFITFLKDNNIGCSVLSNTIQTQKQTDKYIRKLFGEDYPFDLVIASSEYCVKKPDPRFFLLGATKIGVDPKECIYIGDTFRADIRGSSSAGMHPIWINWKKKETPKDVDGLDYLEFTSYKDMIKYFKLSGCKYEF